MKDNGKKYQMNELFKIFQEKDKFFDDLKENFTREVYALIKFHFIECIYNAGLENAIKLFANDIINTVESVIEKDENYPEYRKEIELDNINRLLNKVIQAIENEKFLDNLHLLSKKMISDNYPEIVNLSNFGFRLLERNTKMYAAGFILNIKQKQLLT